MMEDEIDIYEDLPSFDTNECVKHKEEIEELSQKCNNFQQENAELKLKIAELSEANKTLSVNTSSLMKTAKAEISRKDRMITELRQQIDNAVFRRNGYAKPKVQKARPNSVNTKTVSVVKVQETPVRPQPSMQVESDHEDDDSEQKYEPEKFASTVFGERLRKKLLLEEEAEKKRKEEAKLAESEKKAAPAKPDSQPNAETLASSVIGKEAPPEYPNGLPKEAPVSGKSSVVASNSSTSRSYEEDDRSLFERRKLSETIAAKRKNIEVTYPDEKRRRMEDPSYNNEKIRQYNVISKTESRSDSNKNESRCNSDKNDSHSNSDRNEIRSNSDKNESRSNSDKKEIRNSRSSSTASKYRQGNNNRDEFERTRETHSDRTKSNYRSRSRTPDRRYNEKRSDRHRTDKYRAYMDQHEQRRHSGSRRDNDYRDKDGKDAYDYRLKIDNRKVETKIGNRNLYDNYKNSSRDRNSKIRESISSERPRSSGKVEIRAKTDGKLGERRSKSSDRSAEARNRTESTNKNDGVITRSKDSKPNITNDKNRDASKKVDETLSKGCEKETNKGLATSASVPDGLEKHASKQQLASDSVISNGLTPSIISNEIPKITQKQHKEAKTKSEDPESIVGVGKCSIDDQVKSHTPLIKNSDVEITNKKTSSAETIIEATTLELGSKNLDTEKTTNNQISGSGTTVMQNVINQEKNSKKRKSLVTKNDAKIPVEIGRRSFREEKIENIEKFIQNYDDDENSHGRIAKEENSGGNDKSLYTTSSIVDTLSMDMEDGKVENRTVDDSIVSEQILLNSLLTPTKKSVPPLPSNETKDTTLASVAFSGETDRPPLPPISPPDETEKPPLPPMSPPDETEKPPLPPMSPPDETEKPPVLPISPPDETIKPPVLPISLSDETTKTPVLPISPPDETTEPPVLPISPPDETEKQLLPPILPPGATKQLSPLPISTPDETKQSSQLPISTKKPPLPATSPLDQTKEPSPLPIPPPNQTKEQPLPPILPPGETKQLPPLPISTPDDTKQSSQPPITTPDESKQSSQLPITTPDETKQSSQLPITISKETKQPSPPPISPPNETNEPSPPPISPSDETKRPSSSPDEPKQQPLPPISPEETEEPPPLTISPSCETNESLPPPIPPPVETKRPSLPPISPADEKKQPPLPPIQPPKEIKLSSSPITSSEETKQSSSSPIIHPMKINQITSSPILHPIETKTSTDFPPTLTPHETQSSPSLPSPDEKQKPSSSPLSSTEEKIETTSSALTLNEEKPNLPAISISDEKDEQLPVLSVSNEKDQQLPVLPASDEKDQNVTSLSSTDHEEQTPSSLSSTNVEELRLPSKELSLINTKQPVLSSPSSLDEKSKSPPQPHSISDGNKDLPLTTMAAEERETKASPSLLPPTVDQKKLLSTTPNPEDPSKTTAPTLSPTCEKENTPSSQPSIENDNNKEITSTKEISAIKTTRDSNKIEKITSKQITRRHRIPCVPIVSRYSRKKRDMVLADSASSHHIVKSDSSSETETTVGANVELETVNISTKDQKIVTKPISDNSEIVNDNSQSKNEVFKKSCETVQASVSETERKMDVEKTNKMAEPKKKDQKTQISRPTDSVDKIRQSAKNLTINVDESQSDPRSEKKAEVQKSDAFREIENPTKPVDNRETRSALKTIAPPVTVADGVGVSSNRKRPLPKEKENQSKQAAKQCKIMVVARRRRPVHLEDSSVVTTLVPSAHDTSGERTSTKINTVKSNSLNDEKLEPAKTVAATTIKKRKRRSADK